MQRSLKIAFIIVIVLFCLLYFGSSNTTAIVTLSQINKTSITVTYADSTTKTIKTTFKKHLQDSLMVGKEYVIDYHNNFFGSYLTSIEELKYGE